MSFRDRINRSSKSGVTGFQFQQQSIEDEIVIAPPPPPAPVTPSDLFRFLNDPLLKRSSVSRKILSNTSNGLNSSGGGEDDFAAVFGEEEEEEDEGGGVGGAAAATTSGDVSFSESGQPNGGNSRSRTYKRDASSLLRDAVLLQATVVEYHGELLYPDGSTSNEKLLQQHKDQQEAAQALVTAGQAAAAQAAAAAAILQQSANRNSRSMYRASNTNNTDVAASSINTSAGRTMGTADLPTSPMSPLAVQDSTSIGALAVDPPKPSVYHHVQRSHIMNRDALFHGKGSLVSTLGYTYVGEFDRGLMSGKGKIEWNDGASYEGDFRHSMIIGSGKYVWANGDSYEGTVRDAVRHGHGTFTLKLSGEKYDGDWVRGMRHGKGLLRYAPLSSDIYASRCQYDGEWRNDQKCGLGTMVYTSGDVYEGEWKADRRNGWGSMVWKKKNQPVEVYTGEWVDGTQEGYGESTYIRPSSSFAIPTANSKSNNNNSGGGGGGSLAISSATTAQAMRDSATNVYKGEFLGGERNGFGVMQYDDGSRFEGFWRDNQKHGEGKLLTSAGIVFIGAFVNGNPANGGGGDMLDDGLLDEGGLTSSRSNNNKKSLSEVATDIPFNASHAISSSSPNNNSNNNPVSGGGPFSVSQAMSAANTTGTIGATNNNNNATMTSGLRTVASPLPLHIHDILGVGVADPGEAVAEVQNVISRHSGVLKRVFYHYSNLENNVELLTTPGSGYELKNRGKLDTAAPIGKSLPVWRRSRTPGTMHIVQFVRMLSDCHLLNRHVSLAVVGRVLCTFRDLHQSTTAEAFGNIGLPSAPHGQHHITSQQQHNNSSPSQSQSPSQQGSPLTSPRDLSGGGLDSFTPRGSTGTRGGGGSGVAAAIAPATTLGAKATGGKTVQHPPTKPSSKASTTGTPSKKGAPEAVSSSPSRVTRRKTTNAASALDNASLDKPFTSSATNSGAFSPSSNGSNKGGGLPRIFDTNSGGKQGILMEPSAPSRSSQQPPPPCPSTMRRASLQVNSLIDDGGSVAASIQEFMTKKSGVNVAAIKRKAMNNTGLPPSRTSPSTAPIAAAPPALVGQYQVPWREYRANLHTLRNGELTYRDCVEALVRIAALLYSGSSGCTPGSFEIYGSVGRRFAVLVEEHLIPHACVPGSAIPLCEITRDLKPILRTISGNKHGSSKQPGAMNVSEYGGGGMGVGGGGGSSQPKRVNIRADTFCSSPDEAPSSLNQTTAGLSSTSAAGEEVALLDVLTEMFLQFSNGTFIGSSENVQFGSAVSVAHPQRKSNHHLQVAAVNALRSGAGIGPLADGRASPGATSRRSEAPSPAFTNHSAVTSPHSIPLDFAVENSNTTVTSGFTVLSTAGSTMTVRQLMIMIKTLTNFAQTHGVETLFPSNLSVTHLLRKIACGTGPLAKYDRFPSLTTAIARKQHYAAAQVKRLEMPAAANVQAVNELAQSISARNIGRKAALENGGATTTFGTESSISGMFSSLKDNNNPHTTISSLAVSGMSPNRAHLHPSPAMSFATFPNSNIINNAPTPVPTLAQVETEESAHAKADALYLARKSMAKQSKGSSGMNEISTVVMDKEITLVEFVEAVLSLAQVVVGARQRAVISLESASDEAKLTSTEHQVEYFARRVLFPFYFQEMNAPPPTPTSLV